MSRSVVVACVAASGLAMSLSAGARPTVFWGNAAGGSWAIGTNWVGNSAPTLADDAMIDLLGGPYTVTISMAASAASLTINAANATVSHSSSTLNLNGGMLNLLAGAYNLTGGTLSNAVLAGNTFSTQSGGTGTFSGVTLDTNLNVNSGYTLNISNGLTVNAGRSLSMNAGGGFTILDVLGAGNQTIGGGGEVVFNGTSSNGFVRANSGTLVIGAGTTVRSGSQGGTVGQFGILANHGTIASRTNLRTVNVGASSGWANEATGTLEASSGGTLTLNNAWSNLGTLFVDGGTLNLGGTFSTTSITPARWNRTGGTVSLTGTLNNALSTLVLDAQTGSMELRGGTINGGTISTGGGAQLTTPANSSGTFSGGVTLSGDMTLGPSYTLNVNGGLVVNAGRTLTINAGAGFTILDMLGAGQQTLGGGGEVVFDGTSPNGFVRANAGTLVIGQKTTVRSGAQGGNIGQFGSLLNNGTIASRSSGRTVSVTGTSTWTNAPTGVLEASNGGTLTLTGPWTNTGTLFVDGGTMNLGGTFATAAIAPARWDRTGGTVNLTGTATNTSSTMSLDAMTGSMNLMGGTINGGTIQSAGGATLLTPEFSSGTFSGGVTLDTDMTVGPAYTLNVNGGLTLNAGRTVTMGSGGGFTVLDLLGVGNQTLGGGGEVVFDGTSSNAFVRANSGTLVIGENITVRTGAQGGNVGQLGSLTNNGAILSQTAGRTVTLAGTNIHNTGTILAENGGTISISRSGGLTSNTGDPLTARTGGRLNFANGFSASTNGTIDLELASASPTAGYGRITVTGNASISGSDINLMLTGGFNPDWGDTFNILSYGTLTGDMSSLVLPTLSDPVNLRWWRTQTASAFTIGVRILADTNRDGVVDFLDLNNVLSFFGQSGVGLAGDADENGVVDFLDLNHVLSDFGRSAPINPVPAPAGVALAMLGLGLTGGRRRRA